MAHAKTLSDTNYRTLIALLEKESRDLARDRAMVLNRWNPSKTPANTAFLSDPAKTPSAVFSTDA